MKKNANLGRYTLRQKGIGKETPIRTEGNPQINTGDKFTFLFKGIPTVYTTNQVDKGRERAYLVRKNSDGTWISFNEILRRTKVYNEFKKAEA